MYFFFYNIINNVMEVYSPPCLKKKNRQYRYLIMYTKGSKFFVLTFFFFFFFFFLFYKINIYPFIFICLLYIYILKNNYIYKIHITIQNFI